ncbi:MAG TPA: hypothetical protein VFL66_12725 [Gaiellaceae bacterium]|nr:hypothetical protein [Gaiellaceae bacterium]
MRRLLAVTFGISVLAALGLGAGSAHAGLLGCRYPAASQPFAQWGDDASYVPVPGGSFEYSAGWKLSGGAQIVNGNEPFYLGSSGDSHSLLLPPGSSALSPAVCLQILTPTIRAVGSSSNGTGVAITLYTRTLLGLAVLPTAGWMGLGTSWDASTVEPFLLQNVLGLLNLNSANIYFRFTPVGDETVQLDDVYLDPFLAR